MPVQKNVIIPIATIGFVIIISIGASVVVSAHKISTKNASLATIPAVSPAASANSTAATAAYHDGTYTSTGSYNSPGGMATIGVSLTVKGDTITAVSVTPEATDRQSSNYQQSFADGISQIVVGKLLSSSFDVSQVNGASLTGSGFATALAAIRTKASA
jgi:uncharacterized protein with FMN-binding domain